MSLFIASLNSGSNGNCYYVGNHKEAILVDAGISCREIEKRMQRLGLPMNTLKAVFVSHEHTDHIKGVCSLLKKYNLPLYISGDTFNACGFTVEKHAVRHFKHADEVAIGDLLITPFSKLHDACDPFSFIVTYNKITVGVFTDLGVACSNLVTHFKKCHAAFLESNYDEVMLSNGGYPYFLKKRITGGQGHLSNKQALELFNLHRPRFMSHLVLSHLSKNNNCPLLVEQLFNEHAKAVKIIVASRYQETEVYEIGASVQRPREVKFRANQIQLSFSFS